LVTHKLNADSKLFALKIFFDEGKDKVEATRAGGAGAGEVVIQHIHENGVGGLEVGGQRVRAPRTRSKDSA